MTLKAPRKGEAVDRRILVALLLALSVGPAGCLAWSDGGELVATNQVLIPGPWVFEPTAIQVTNGTEITWTNNGGQSHTVTFKALGIDEIVKPKASVTLILPGPGDYTYTCRFHPPDMTGTVRVLPAGATAGSNDTRGPNQT